MRNKDLAGTGILEFELPRNESPPDRRQRTAEPGTLTKHELRGELPFDELLAKAAGICKTTLYAWMGDCTFKTEFERQRNELVETAFRRDRSEHPEGRRDACGPSGHDTGDNRRKRLAANGIISGYLKHKELADVERRIEAIEERLEGH